MIPVSDLKTEVLGLFSPDPSFSVLGNDNHEAFFCIYLFSFT